MTNISERYNLIMKLLVSLLINFVSCQPDVQYLIFTSPQGKENESGVFAGQIDFTVNRSSAVDLYQLGETCTQYNDKSSFVILYPILPSGISYDLKSHHLTFRLSPHTDMITLSSGTLCPAESLCDTAPQTFLLNTNYPFGTLGPFVVYDNQFYYILERLSTSNNTDNSSVPDKRMIELFVMEDCQSRFPLFNTSIDLTQCSRNLSVILDEPYSEDTLFVMGTHMTMVDTAQERIFLFVLFQFDNNTLGRNGNCEFTVIAKLYSVFESGNSESLSEIPLTNCWNPDAVAAVPGVGGVSYYPDQICWSALEGIWCGTWVSQTFEDVLQVLQADTVSHICSAVGSGDPDPNADVILTGVAVHQAFNSVEPTDLSLYFGCQFAGATRGGSGWLWRSQEQNSTEVEPLLSGGKPVWAGALQFSPTMSQNCDDEDDNGDNGDGGGGGGNSGTNVFVTQKVVLAGIILTLTTNLNISH